MPTFFIRIAGDALSFSACHFITIEGGVCERLHGHTYRVAAEVHGPPGPEQYVVDFVVVRDILKSLVEELDHRVLLPAEHPTVKISQHNEEVEAVWNNRRWIFPKGDCLLLPVANTTSESLCCYLGRRLMDALSDLKKRPSKVIVEIDEGDGFTAGCALE